ncbi:MAG: hypothetical protein E6R04_02455 [Spirochaetes bacterium]|nr:MAG: hypothetical protein E6R04_02455 [Spirochaetota bacterium]
MSKLLLQEFAQFDYKKPVDDDGKPRLSKYGNILVRGVIQRADALNQNGRVYPRHILEREVRNYMTLVKERRATGELDHADSPTVNLQNASHIITDVWWEGNDLWGEIEVLEDLDQGRNLKGLLKNDVKVGISSRALGSVQKLAEADVVQEDLYLVCWDIVSEPSTHGAFMMQEAKSYSDEEVRRIVSKADRIDRAVNEVLALKGKR